MYFAQSKGPEGHVKIGYSENVADRIRTLTTAHPHGVDLVALLPGDRSLEAAFHASFESSRLNGEWFSRDVLLRLVRQFYVGTCSGT